jgi:alcohol dehydrogenase (cytochrome c)
LITTSALLALGLMAQAPPPPVTFERLRNAAAEPHNWLTYSGSYNGQRHSPLAQIKPGNVAAVTPTWVYQSRESGKIETSPIVVDGVVYITEKPHIVTALDGRTGRPLWSYRRPPVSVATCCGPVNRGLAVLDDALYLGTLDAHLVALDMKTGRVRWEVTVADYKTGHSITVAPLAVKDKIVVGIAGGEFGIRGFLDAYHARTGKRAWRLWTVPAPGQPGHETWNGGKGNAWKTGGAPTWVTGAYDPATNLLYWGTGNPAPDYNGDDRKGDNLYSNCLLAIDADSGKLRWHFQYTPHDLHDWDANQVPMLIDAPIGGKPRKLVAQANRNAFFYLLDRLTGEFLVGTPFARQSWASGLDPRGRPRLLPGSDPTPEGTLVYPGLAGATNWFSPAYNPATGLVYVQAREDYAQIFHKTKSDYQPGEHFEGGSARDVEGAEHYGVLKAIEALTGKIRWQWKQYAPPSGGVLSTAGGLVWSGNREGWFFALDATTGRPLWRFQTGGLIWANPISFAVDGQQQVAIAAGQGIFVFGLPRPPTTVPR